MKALTHQMKERGHLLLQQVQVAFWAELIEHAKHRLKMVSLCLNNRKGMENN